MLDIMIDEKFCNKSWNMVQFLLTEEILSEGNGLFSTVIERKMSANYKRLCPSSSSRPPQTVYGANANWDKNRGDCSFCVATGSFLASPSPLFIFPSF